MLYSPSLAFTVRSVRPAVLSCFIFPLQKEVLSESLLQASSEGMTSCVLQLLRRGAGVNWTGKSSVGAANFTQRKRSMRDVRAGHGFAFGCGTGNSAGVTVLWCRS